MTPSSWTSAPSMISFQRWRSIAWVTIARLRIRDAGIRASSSGETSERGERFLLGEGAVDLVAQRLRQFAAQPLRFPREQVARPFEIDRDDRLDPARAGGKDDDAVGQGHRLVDVMCHEQHRGTRLR